MTTGASTEYSKEGGVGGFRSANLHITSECNYSCGFCFSRGLCYGRMDAEGWAPVLERLRSAGIEKVNIAGGEPFLHPDLEGICRAAKGLGFIVGIVSNGSLAGRGALELLDGCLDWLGLSVDSVSEEAEDAMGRGTGDKGHIARVAGAADEAHRLGMDVKLNITVTAMSAGDDFTGLIRRVDPQRAKVFQVLELGNVNSEGFSRYAVTDEAFEAFRRRHSGVRLSNGTGIVFEDNATMEGSYLMLDPLGRAMTNTGRVLEVHPLDGFMEGGWRALDYGRYVARDGLYFL